MVPQVRKDFYLKFVTSGLRAWSVWTRSTAPNRLCTAIESHLHLALAEHFNAEITSSVIANKQDAVDWRA
jgi:pre-mRNA-splicing helicase BRR2